MPIDEGTYIVDVETNQVFHHSTDNTNNTNQVCSYMSPSG